MRKTRRLSREQLAPWVWELPGNTLFRAHSLLPPAGPESAPQNPTPAVPDPPRPIDWVELFGNAHPVEIEVGMGKGLFLLNAAMTRPETNFFGIEIVRKYQLYAATRFAIRHLPNVKTACADAKLLLRDYVAPGSVAAVHVYFPDPWWKKRHKKRRVFTPEFAADVARSLSPGGRLLIATDVEEYFGVMTAIVRAMPQFVERPEEADRAAPRTDAGFATNFERKALARGGAVWRAVYERVITTTHTEGFSTK
ncbi:MAG: tRNA (guanosine(46)-N7)-methyltransferase TrmB [Gemmataceae bacterium]|nr:tRNA (guanosine(46)-N7)-methyltransferase TrmB [Gemmata sp.]MDW8197418.1 tRNA (guanosine(46)-N7)-methyltransferase TrmB [Gemmataceae bacterium]